MGKRVLVTLAAWVSLVVIGGRASAELIIDENFDANPLIDSKGPMVPVSRMMAGMWLRDMSAPFGMWQHTFDTGMASPHVVGMMTMGMMSMDPWSRTLTYFVAMPPGGWGGDTADFSFAYMYMSMNPMATRGMFGVYGWPANATVHLDSPTPGIEGTELISGELGFFPAGAGQTGPGVSPAQPPGWSHAGGTYTGNLSDLAYIGVTFTFGVDQGGAEPPELRIDDVRLDVQTIPEPATIVLVAMGVATAAWLRRRRSRALFRAAGPPG